MSSTKLAIIIPTFNRIATLEPLLKQIYFEQMVNIELFVIVIIDGSTDGTKEMLTSYYPQVYQVLGDGTWWYTRSMNEGFNYVINNISCNFILCLNDDVSLKGNYFSTIVSLINNQQNYKKIIGSISVKESKSFELCFQVVKSINFIQDKSIHYKQEEILRVKNSEKNELLSTVALPGRGLLIPREILIDLKGFDNKFFQYQSDYDFCLRALKKGFRSYICPNLEIICYKHLTSGTSLFLKPSINKVFSSLFDKTSRYYLCNRSNYYWRHYYKILWPFYMAKYIFIILIKAKWR